MSIDILKNQPHPKVGVAFSGGFIRSAAAIGALEVLEENGIPIHAVSGCSAGSGIAAAYAAGNLEVLKKRLLSKFSDYWKVIFEPTFPKTGLLKGQRTRKFFKEFVGEKNFSDMDMELYITATDLNNLKPVILAEGSVADAIQASVGVPGMFIPVRRGDKILTDGGNFNLIPSQVLYDSGADYVIAIDVSQNPNLIIRFLAYLFRILGSQIKLFQISPKFEKEDPNVFDLIWRATKLSATRIQNFYHFSYQYNVLIKPNLKGIKRWNVGKVDHLVHLGRAEAERVVAKIKEDLNLVDISNGTGQN